VRGCMVRNRLFTFHPGDAVSAMPDQEFELARFCCQLQAIPLPNNSLDGAVLHHALELVGDPRTAVRELARVLAPGSRLLICGFNPLSLWGLRRGYARLFDDHFSGLRFINPVRLQDWLTVLGFEVCEEVRYLAYGLPFARRSSRNLPTSRLHPVRWGEAVKAVLRKHNPPIGGVYMISAVKQAAVMRRDWDMSRARNPKLAPVAYPKLSARNRIERSG